MKILIVCLLSAVGLAVGALALFPSKRADFTTAQIDEIWTQLWKSGGPTTQPPNVEALSDQEVLERLTGRWTVMFGVTPDLLTISVGTNRLVAVSGRKDGKDWSKNGHWRVVSGKLVLFMEQEAIPSFIFRTGQSNYIFDPWAKMMMSELQREK